MLQHSFFSNYRAMFLSEYTVNSDLKMLAGRLFLIHLPLLNKMKKGEREKCYSGAMTNHFIIKNYPTHFLYLSKVKTLLCQIFSHMCLRFFISSFFSPCSFSIPPSSHSFLSFISEVISLTFIQPFS